MPIYVGPDIIDPVSIGKVAISSGWVGVDKVYGLAPAQVLTLTSAEDFDLKTFIDASGADYTKPIIINMASDQVIGGVTTTAFTIAGLPTHSTITININGQIQGYTSGDAVASDEPLDVVSTGQISGGISVGLDIDTSLITFVISSTGKVLGGGGNGGAGGKGGQGDWITNQEGPLFQDNVYEWWYGRTVATISPSYWAGNQVFTNESLTRTIRAVKVGSYWYLPGEVGINPQYEIARGIAVTGVAGNGGNGGLGAGYSQTRTDGANGGTGTYRSGNGGQGGHGGDWGVAGGEGQKGGTGLYIDTWSASNTRLGANGTAGQTAGMSFYLSTSNLRFYGVDSPQARALGL